MSLSKRQFTFEVNGMIKYLFIKKIENYINRYQTTFTFTKPSKALKGMGLTKGDAIDFDNINTFITKQEKLPFSRILFDFIDKSGKTDSEIYRAAGVDRRIFSKIRCNEHYIPKKRTIIAIGIAIKLSRTQMEELLMAGGYSLSYSEVFDLIIMYCIDNQIYSIAKINIALEHFNIPLFNAE